MASQESIPDLIRGTIRDGIGIVRDEILLARTEMREEVVRIKSGLARERFMPKSVETLKENAEWLRARTES
jgi:hypothetical protein